MVSPYPVVTSTVSELRRVDRAQIARESERAGAQSVLHAPDTRYAQSRCAGLRKTNDAKEAQLLSLRAPRRQSNKASDSACAEQRATRPVSPPPGLPKALT